MSGRAAGLPVGASPGVDSEAEAGLRQVGGGALRVEGQLRQGPAARVAGARRSRVA